MSNGTYYLIGIYSIHGPTIVNGKNDFSPSRILIITSPANGNEHQKEQVTHMYPTIVRKGLDCLAFPNALFQHHWIKSSQVIADACHMKYCIMPIVLSAMVILVGEGSMSMEAAWKNPDTKNASHICVYEDQFVLRFIPTASTKAPVKPLSSC